MALWGQVRCEDIPFLPEKRLEGFRVTVRPPCVEDWPRWAEVRGRNRDHLTPFEPVWPEHCLTREFFLQRLSRQSRVWREDRGYPFLIFDRVTGTLIGGININSVCRGAAQSATLGYWLDQDCQGQGYMSEAIRLVIVYGFNELQLHRLHAACLPDNRRSIHLLLRAGFKEEGYAERYLRINGQWRDHRLFGLVAD